MERGQSQLRNSQTSAKLRINPWLRISHQCFNESSPVESPEPRSVALKMYPHVGSVRVFLLCSNSFPFDERQTRSDRSRLFNYSATTLKRNESGFTYIWPSISLTLLLKIFSFKLRRDVKCACLNTERTGPTLQLRPKNCSLVRTQVPPSVGESFEQAIA